MLGKIIKAGALKLLGEELSYEDVFERTFVPKYKFKALERRVVALEKAQGVTPKPVPSPFDLED